MAAPVQDFDTRNPPMSITNPTRDASRGREFLEYPKHLRSATGDVTVVNSAEEEATALAAGKATKGSKA